MSSQSSKSRGKIVLKKNKTINKIWHPESTLVFKSSKEKLVIGRYEDGEIIPLDEIYQMARIKRMWIFLLLHARMNLLQVWQMEYKLSLQ